MKVPSHSSVEDARIRVTWWLARTASLHSGTSRETTVTLSCGRFTVGDGGRRAICSPVHSVSGLASGPILDAAEELLIAAKIAFARVYEDDPEYTLDFVLFRLDGPNRDDDSALRFALALPDPSSPSSS